MKPDNQELGDIYEEGIFDRLKAGVSGISGGVKGFFGGKGYAKSAQQAKHSSLMRSFLTKISRDISNFESKIYSKKSQSYQDVSAKLQEMKKIIKNYS